MTASGDPVVGVRFPCVTRRVAVWNGSRTRAEEIKAEIKTFLAVALKLRLSEEKTLITHIDDGFDFLGYRIQGAKRWSDGKWCMFSRVPPKAIGRFREAVKTITRNTSTDEVAAFTALTGPPRVGRPRRPSTRTKASCC